MWIRTKVVSAALAIPMAAIVAFTGGPPAYAAIDPGTIISIVKQAYEAYKMLTQTQELTLDQAVAQIEQSVNEAKTEILDHVDLIADSGVRACARSAVIAFANFPNMSTGTQQGFAIDTIDCVSQAWSLIGAVDDLGSVDHIGFALGLVGPIALAASAAVGWSTDGLAETVIEADNIDISRLNPGCWTVTEPYFDERGHPVPSLADNYLYCKAYNGDQGSDYVQGRTPPGGWNYSNARAQALSRTSSPLAMASLSVLNA
jgi:hypothetical protein